MNAVLPSIQKNSNGALETDIVTTWPLKMPQNCKNLPWEKPVLEVFSSELPFPVQVYFFLWKDGWETRDLIPCFSLNYKFYCSNVFMLQTFLHSERDTSLTLRLLVIAQGSYKRKSKA